MKKEAACDRDDTQPIDKTYFRAVIHIICQAFYNQII